MELIFLRGFITYGSFLCIILAVLSIFIWVTFMGSNTCIMSTMATFAMGYPLGLVADHSLRQIEFGLLLIYFVGCLIAWGLAYILETELKHPIFQTWRARMNSWSVYFCIAYFIGGIVSTKILDIIKKMV